MIPSWVDETLRARGREQFGDAPSSFAGSPASIAYRRELRLRVERPRLDRARLERLRVERPRARVDRGRDLVVPRRLLLERLRAPLAFRRRVAAPFRADAERERLEREAEARPPILPPFREELRLVFFPLPDPLFLPPPVSLFTVAQARRSASPRGTPRPS